MSVDGGVPVEVDLYSPSVAYQQVVFEASGLSAGSHSLRIEVTGTKSVSSTAAWVEIDAIEAVDVTPA